MTKRSLSQSSIGARKRRCSEGSSASPEDSHLSMLQDTSSSSSSSTITGVKGVEHLGSSPVTPSEAARQTSSNRSESIPLSGATSSSSSASDSSERSASVEIVHSTSSGTRSSTSPRLSASEPPSESGSLYTSSASSERCDIGDTGFAHQPQDIVRGNLNQHALNDKAPQAHSPVTQGISDALVASRTRKTSCDRMSVSAPSPLVDENRKPMFSDWDVVVRMEFGNTQKRLRLESRKLAKNSTWFANSFRQGTSREGGSVMYAYKLHHTAGSWELVCEEDFDEAGTLIEAGKRDGHLGMMTPTSEASERNSLPQKTHEPAIISTYTQVLGALQGHTIRLSNKDIQKALCQAERLVLVATKLGCLPLIRQDITSTFPPYRQALYLAISTSPLRWLRLSLVLQDRLIFTESVVHLVGSYPVSLRAWEPKKYILPAEIQNLIHRKSEELQARCMEAERELLLCTVMTTDGKPVSLSDATFDEWMTVQIFRDGLVHELSALEHREGVLHRGSVYRAIFTGSCKFMEFENMKDMSKLIRTGGIGDEGLAKEVLDKLKGYVAQVLEDLVKNEVLIDLEANGIGWLTCGKVDEVPW